jgi:hypothetical protein
VTRRLAVVVGGVVAALAVVALLFYFWYEQTPPALVLAGPGTVRLNGSCCGVPAAPHMVTLADGSTVTLLYGSIEEGGDRPEASFRLEHQPGSARLLTMHEGDRKTVGGVTVRVLHIWVTPKPSHEAIDVRVTMG